MIIKPHKPYVAISKSRKSLRAVDMVQLILHPTLTVLRDIRMLDINGLLRPPSSPAASELLLEIE